MTNSSQIQPVNLGQGATDFAEQAGDKSSATTPDANGWLPIESAPKDGEAFLAWDGVGVTLAWYPGVEEFQSFCHDGDFVSIQQVTHWHPLPKPPVSEPKP